MVPNLPTYLLVFVALSKKVLRMLHTGFDRGNYMFIKAFRWELSLNGRLFSLKKSG